jgi:hypothetical protein
MLSSRSLFGFMVGMKLSWIGSAFLSTLQPLPLRVPQPPTRLQTTTSLKASTSRPGISEIRKLTDMMAQVALLNNATNKYKKQQDDFEFDNDTLRTGNTVQETSIPTTSLNATSSSLPNCIQGIGGDGGFSYDVNSLKRNLLQETVRAYKRELYNLLTSPASTEQAITEKLGALVQASPLRTTTDSNLLDGTWALAFQSKYATYVDLKRVRPTKFTRKQQQQASSSSAPQSSSRRRVGGKESLVVAKQRTFCLEHVRDDDDASVVDECYYAGVIRRARRYRVGALTRTSLVLQYCRATEWFLFSKRVLVQREKHVLSEDAQVVYVDGDLCILARKDYPNFYVYTKDKAWLNNQQRTKRKLRFLWATFKLYVLDKIMPKKVTAYPSAQDSPILQEIQIDSAKLRVLKLGDLRTTGDESWDSLSDPFVHLEADERQRVLKAMNVRQIEIAANQRISKSRREKWFQRLFQRRKTYFKKPRGL